MAIKTIEDKTVAEWAAELGITPAALYLRIKLHGESKAVRMAKNARAQMNYRGKTVNEWAAELNVKPAQVRYRVSRYGWAKAILMLQDHE